MINVEMMKHAARLLEEVDTLLSQSGLYEHATAHSTFALRDLIDDLDIDITRAENGTLENDEE